MRWGISGHAVPSALRYAKEITQASLDLNFTPLFAYAIAWRESISLEAAGQCTAATVVSRDGGHGLFQLTSWVPDDWEVPQENAHYAIADWLLPDVQFWNRTYGLTGDDLIRCTAASFNAGRGAAIAAHNAGNVDSCTTDHYGAGVLAIYHNLLANGTPTS